MSLQMSESEVVGTVDVGTPLCLSEPKTMVFNFHNFEQLQDKCHSSSAISCHGHQWAIQLFPFGNTEESEADGYISVFLSCKDPPQKGIKTSFSLRMGDTKGGGETTFHPVAASCVGWDELFQRSAIVSSHLDANGTLTITVDLQIYKERTPVWRPQNIMQQKLVQFFRDKEGKDVTFLIGDNVVKAHKWLVSINCPTLHDLVAESDDSVLQIDNANPDLFAILIRFMYFNDLPTEPPFDIKEKGLELLKLANGFDCKDLKLILEADITESNILTVENAADILLLADSHSFAMLKEAAMKLVVDNLSKVRGTEGWNAMEESNSLLLEVIANFSGNATTTNCAEKDMSVSKLRKRLADRGLDVDGTKEMLVKRLRFGGN